MSDYVASFEQIASDVKEYERPYSIDVNQIAARATPYGQYISAATAMMSTWLSIRGTMIQIEELREKADGSECSHERARARLYLQVEERRAKKMSKRFCRLFAAAMHLLEKLPDLSDPETRYRLEEEEQNAAARERLMRDFHTTGLPSLAFWDLYKRITDKAVRQELYAMARPPRDRSDAHDAVFVARRMAMDDWAQDKRASNVARELRGLSLPDEAPRALLEADVIPALPAVDLGEVMEAHEKEVDRC